MFWTENRVMMIAAWS